MLSAKVYLYLSDVCDKVNLFVRIGDGRGSPPPECLEIQEARKVKFLLESHSSSTHDLLFSYSPVVCQLEPRHDDSDLS